MADVFCDDFASVEVLSEDFIFTPMEDCDGKEKEESECENRDETHTQQIDAASGEVKKDYDPLGPSSKNLRNIFETLASSDYVQDRLICAQSIMEQLHTAESKEDLLSVISRMCKLGDDEEPVVRSELLYSLPYIALFCKEHSEDLNAIIRQQVVPYTVKLLTDEQITVRKFGHSSLKVLMENNILDNSQLNDWICPLLAELVMSTNTAEDLRLEDVSVMCKVIPYIEKDITKKFFLTPFISLCCDTAFTIRKVCAVNFGTLCQVLGTETTEQTLLPAFLNLCNDELWGVRKECADVFVDVSKSVSSETRREILPHFFISLLNDKYHYVKLAAYESLGGVISTFAESSYDDDVDNQQKTKLRTDCVNEIKVRTNQNQAQSNLLEKDNQCSKTVSVVEEGAYYMTLSYSNNNIDDTVTFSQRRDFNLDSDIQNVCNNRVTASNISLVTNNNLLDSCVQNENLYNNFQFWRTPLPEIEPDIDFISFKSKSSISSSNFHSQSSGTCWVKEDISDFKKSSMEKRELFLLRSTQKNGDKIVKKMTVYDQNIVPHELLTSFITGVENNKDCTVFAYNFYAVAFTLGRKYWPCIRHVYLKLAHDEKEAVRATVACFLHELAAYLGRDITLNDLLPVFLIMSKDSDAVRVKVLMYLSKFLQHLRPSERSLFLPFIKEFLSTDTERSWRFRFTVAEQLIPCVPLFDLSEISSHFLPVSLAFMNDRASDVRRSAIKLFSAVIKSFLQHTDSVYNQKALSLLESEIKVFKESNKWLQRQMYVFICQELANAQSLSEELYIEKIVPNLLSLAWDFVPNVRLAVARCLCLTLFPLDFLPSLHLHKTHYQLLLQVMFSLQSDVDRDVRHFAHLSDGVFNVFLTKKLSPV